MLNANENQNKNLQLKNAIFSMTVCKINMMTSVIQDAQSKDKYIWHAYGKNSNKLQRLIIVTFTIKKASKIDQMVKLYDLLVFMF